jgi:hypothetical protein
LKRFSNAMIFIVNSSLIVISHHCHVCDRQRPRRFNPLRQT